MPRFEIRLAGLGGQGVILAGSVLGRAAVVFGNMRATQTQSYGPESRGSACKTEVVVSDEEIDFPKLQKPNLIVVMSQDAFNTNINDASADCMIVYDPDMVTNATIPPDVPSYAIPATKIAERLGKKIVANMVMVGAITELTKILDEKVVEKAVAASSPRGTGGINIKAFNEGCRFVRENVKGKALAVEAQSGT